MTRNFTEEAERMYWEVCSLPEPLKQPAIRKTLASAYAAAIEDARWAAHSKIVEMGLAGDMVGSKKS